MSLTGTVARPRASASIAVESRPLPPGAGRSSAPRPAASSIYERVLGSDFRNLHPQIQRRFGFSSSDGVASIGQGVMDEVWRGAWYTLPFLYLGSFRRIMFPERGRNVPFRIENYAYRDRFGRETVTWCRTFHFPRIRRFDATMIYSEARGGIVDYLGTHQHLAVDIDLSVDPTGGLRLCSGAQRLYAWPVGFTFPLLFSGTADVCEWFDESTRRFRIDVKVSNRRFGPLFGYRGSFDATWLPVGADQIPVAVRPKRLDARGRSAG